MDLLIGCPNLDRISGIQFDYGGIYIILGNSGTIPTEIRLDSLTPTQGFVIKGSVDAAQFGKKWSG